MHEGKLPAAALLDAAMIFFAGALLLTPGMLTDAFGVSLLIPFCRHWYRRRLMAWIRRHFKVQAFHATTLNEDTGKDQRSKIIDSYVIDPPPATRKPRNDEES